MCLWHFGLQILGLIEVKRENVGISNLPFSAPLLLSVLNEKLPDRVPLSALRKQNKQAHFNFKLW